MIAVTGATGQLGQLVIKHLLNMTDAENIAALVRDVDRAGPLNDLGIQVRRADYTEPTILDSALAGVERLLLISSSEVGQRTGQHMNVIDAAKNANVRLLAYTSLLHADTSPLALAEEHIATEEYLGRESVPHAILRNGWYSENYLSTIPSALATGEFIGCAKDGKISSSARDDYAEAAAVVLTSSRPQDGKVYELAGDDSYTLAELCAVISDESGKAVRYIDMEEAEYADALKKVGLPVPLAAMLANSDAGASKGALFHDGHELSTLIGRPTKPLRQLVKEHVSTNQEDTL